MSSNKSSPLITIADIYYYYSKRLGYFKKKRFSVLNNVSFKVYPGETLGIIGRNGAGKTTLLKLIAGIFEPDRGKIITNGIRISMLSLQAGFVPFLSARENTYLSGMILGMTKKEIKENMDSIKSFSGLQDWFEEPIRSYSTGMKARLGFSIGLQLDTDMLLIDEVMGVGDGEFRAKSTAQIKEKIKSNKTVVLVSHTIQTINELCDRVVWIENGTVNSLGKPSEVLPSYQKYLKSVPTIQ
jgi:lipopolysaccharide transport system ATP-binding protein